MDSQSQMKLIYFLAGGIVVSIAWLFINLSHEDASWVAEQKRKGFYFKPEGNAPEIKEFIQEVFPNGSVPRLNLIQQRQQIAFDRLKDYHPCLEIDWLALNYTTSNELRFASQYIDRINYPPLIACREDAITYIDSYLRQYAALLEELTKRAEEVNTSEKSLKSRLKEQISLHKNEATRILIQWVDLKEWQTMVHPLILLFNERVALLRNNQKVIENLLALGCILDTREGFKLPKDHPGIWRDLKPIDYYFEHSSFKLKNTDWVKIDRMGLPPSSLRKIKNHYYHRLSGRKYNLLRETMLAYNNLPKTDPLIFPDRIHLLSSLANMANNFQKSINTPKYEAELLHQISTTASHKARYLSLLLQAKEKIARYEYLCSKESPQMLVVRMTKLDALENLDPAHRLTFHHREYADLWRRTHRKDFSLFDYYIWLEGMNTDEMTTREIDPLFTREEKRVHFHAGVAYNPLFANHSRASIMDGLYLYVLDEEENLYIFPDEKSAPDLQNILNKRLHFPFRGRIYHHDIIISEPFVLCAGKIEFYQGKIKKIDNYSGHFSPDFNTHLKNAVKILGRYKAFHEDALVGNFEGNDMPLKSFLSHPLKS